jgi:hypothetical protein
MSRWSQRRRSWLCAAAAALLCGTGIGTAQPARAAEQCPARQPLFAVLADTGHLVEVTACTSTPEFGPAVLVDDGDWRGHRQVFGAREGTTVVLYTIDAGGALWARRQDAPGTGFGPPVRVGAEIDWSRFASVFVPQRGYLHAIERLGPIRTFQHLNWSTGGTDVSPEQPLLLWAGGPMAAVKWGGFAEAISGHDHIRIWWNPAYPQRAEYDSLWFSSGELPPDVTGVVGYEPWLYGIDAAGDLVRLNQASQPPAYQRCNPNAWHIAARSSGGYVRIVLPMGRSSSRTTPQLAARPAVADWCVGDGPLEWQ